MPTNLELKIKLENFIVVKQRLTNLKAKFIQELNQKDIYFKVSGFNLKLRIENGHQSLIKYLRNEDGSDRWSDYEIVKTSEGDLEKLLSSVLEIETVVEKKRLLYMFDNTRIHLDEVKYLGNFLELETLVLKDKKEAKKNFEELIMLLDLKIEKQFRKSYKELMKEIETDDLNKK